ncbi:hypothetical protein BD289DRAFT_422421 [Coniella lustricola]|uniref:Uncharacterized protein n=1 Tax=Coniella lustricola TaxID=2025994 RepID=A0A2T3AKX8_9PEZI|nr:hypothetical protein BD289DRAFT_422421 [Coniella lustricola]
MSAQRTIRHCHLSPLYIAKCWSHLTVWVQENDASCSSSTLPRLKVLYRKCSRNCGDPLVSQTARVHSGLHPASFDRRRIQRSGPSFDCILPHVTPRFVRTKNVQAISQRCTNCASSKSPFRQDECLATLNRCSATWYDVNGCGCGTAFPFGISVVAPL